MKSAQQSGRSWKSFFIHIATICIGLSIAVGLEQSVEASRRQHERNHRRGWTLDGAARSRAA
jgi:hypothetical protein